MDDRLRALERRWRETGAADDHLRWLQERIRSGELLAEDALDEASAADAAHWLDAVAQEAAETGRDVRLPAAKGLLAAAPGVLTQGFLAVAERLPAAMGPARQALLRLAPTLAKAAASAPPRRPGDAARAVQALVAWPGLVELKGALAALEATLKAVETPEEARRELVTLVDRTEGSLAQQLGRVLLAASSHRRLGLPGPTPGQPWSDALLADVAARPAAVAATWRRLFEHLHTAEAHRPTDAWLGVARPLVAALPDFDVLVPGWLDRFAAPDPPPGLSPWGFVPLVGAGDTIFLRGLAWACAGRTDPVLVQAVGRLASTCLTKVPNFGPLSAAAGHACIHALSATEGRTAQVQLEALQRSVDYSVAGSILEDALRRRR